ncbi:MAG: response regulator transcription factor [Pseudomonadota bacterium]
MRILLVEDDEDLSTAIAEALRRADYVVDVAMDGEDGGHLGETEQYDAIVLDVGLPKIDGLSILAEWRRADIGTPVLILTARDGWRDKVEGLRRGADDYLAKPFQPQELEARLEALIRRSRGLASSILRVGTLEIDLSARQVSINGRVISLSPTEYRALAHLALNRGNVISKTALTEHLYDSGFDYDSNVIEVTVARLRRKIGAELIETRRGHGYILR